MKKSAANPKTVPKPKAVSVSALLAPDPVGSDPAPQKPSGELVPVFGGWEREPSIERLRALAKAYEGRFEGAID